MWKTQSDRLGERFRTLRYDIRGHGRCTPAFATEHPQVIEDMRARLVATPAEGYAGCCEAIAAMDLTGDLPSISAPTLGPVRSRRSGHPAGSRPADRRADPWRAVR